MWRLTGQGRRYAALAGFVLVAAAALVWLRATAMQLDDADLASLILVGGLGLLAFVQMCVVGLIVAARGRPVRGQR